MNEIFSNPIFGPIAQQFLTNQIAPPTQVIRQEVPQGSPAPYGEMSYEEAEDTIHYIASMGDSEMLSEEIEAEVDTSLAEFGDVAMGAVGSRQGMVSLARKMGGEIRKVYGKLKTTNRKVNWNRKQVIKLNNKIARGASRVRSQQKQDRWLQAVLTVGQALPGIKAYRGMTSDARQKLVETVTDIYKAKIGDKADKPAAFTYATLTGAAGTYSDANIDTIVAEVHADTQAVGARLEALEALVHDLLDAFEAEDFGDTLKSVQTESTPDSLGDLATLLPAQIGDKERALAVVVAKHLLGNPGTGSGGFNFGFTS